MAASTHTAMFHGQSDGCTKGSSVAAPGALELVGREVGTDSPAGNSRSTTRGASDGDGRRDGAVVVRNDGWSGARDGALTVREEVNAVLALADDGALAPFRVVAGRDTVAPPEDDATMDEVS
jgi:hypothetical protein